MPTNREEIEARAGSQWDAAHDPNRPKRTPEQAAAIAGLFDKVDAVTKLKSFGPKQVAKTLGLKLKYEKTGGNEFFTIYEAHLTQGAIRRVEVRVGAEKARVLLILDVDPGLGIVPGEVIDRYGDPSIDGPSIHAPADAPYYYCYEKPGGTLRLGIKPGDIHTFVSVVWDTMPTN